MAGARRGAVVVLALAASVVTLVGSAGAGPSAASTGGVIAFATDRAPDRRGEIYAVSATGGRARDLSQSRLGRLVAGRPLARLLGTRRPVIRSR